MKKALTLALALTLLAVGMGLAGVTNSKHDLTSRSEPETEITFSNEPSTEQICVFCHHPHGKSEAQTYPLLWNVRSAPVGYFYPTYWNSPTLTPTWRALSIPIDVDGGPEGSEIDKNRFNEIVLLKSITCMNCHDGTIGAVSFRKDAADGSLGEFTWIERALADLGATLADDHPVGFVYPDESAPKFGDLSPRRLPVGKPAVVGEVTNTIYPLYGEEDEATMQCSTCHDVHAGQTSVVQFMRHETSGGGEELDIISGSRICRDCHTAK